MNVVKKILFLLLLLVFSLTLHGKEFQVKTIESSGDLPEKFCSAWKKGDFLISDGKNLVLLAGVNRTFYSMLNYPMANAMGSIISFVPAGKNLKSTLNIGSPVIRVKGKREYLVYSSIKPLGKTTPEGALVFEASASYSGKKGEKARVKTLYHFSPQTGRIDIMSTLTNTGKKEFKDLDYSIYFGPFSRYYFSPFHREKHPDLPFRIYQKNGHYLAWLNLNPSQEEQSPDVPGKLAPKKDIEIRHALLVDTRYDKLLHKIYEFFNIKTEEATLHFKDFRGGLMEIIVRDAFSSSVFFRSFLQDPFSINFPIPEGTYNVRANIFPAVREKLFHVGSKEENTCVFQNPSLGRVKVKITNSKGEFVPGKVTFIGLSPTKTPYFKPEDPSKNGRYWESFKNSRYPKEEGLEVKLPVGTYLIYASRGPEYSMDQKIVEILKDEPQEFIFRIDKVVKTPNLISVDPHMHTFYSDGYVRVSERIKSVVAEGVDVAFATDHNRITDYYPSLEKLGLNTYLAVILACEVTTSGVIHYNTYPLKYRPEEENNGAIDPRSEEASPLFKASRKKDPGAILQVNHPRSGSNGYFNNYKLDPESAAFAGENFDLSFDVLEIMNGPYFYSSNYEAIEDWFHLLNRGYYFPLMASSDSHSIDRGEPGYSRTYVVYKGEEGDGLNWTALAHSIKKGRSFASNGPIVEFKVNKTYSSGDTFTSSSGKVDIWIKVQSAPWISVDEVRLIVNGEREIIFPVKTEIEVIEKFNKQFSLILKKDSYIAVEVLGKETLYPVLQRSSGTGLLEDAILPYALTNPVFIDVDGNRKFDPPLPRKIHLIPRASESKGSRAHF
jgi:hypothetical protein